MKLPSGQAADPAAHVKPGGAAMPWGAAQYVQHMQHGPAQCGTLALTLQQCKEWIVVPLLQTQLALEERASQTKTKFSMPMSRKAARLHPMLSACRVALPAEFKAHLTHGTEQNAVPLQAQPATQELPSWAQTNFSLPMASEAARSRHALLPTMSSARRVTPASTASMGPLYPSFDSSPIAPIDYGPAHAAQQQALPPPPSAPPMPQHVRPPCSPPTLGNSVCPPAWTSCAPALAPCDWPHRCCLAA